MLTICMSSLQQRAAMPKTVMIVDDSRVSRMMIRSHILKVFPGWTIIEADDGDDALSKLSEQTINYFSVDYNMPGLDGLSLIARLREQCADSRYALLTANIQDALRARAYELGVLCVNKPITDTSVGEILEYFNE